MLDAHPGVGGWRPTAFDAVPRYGPPPAPRGTPIRRSKKTDVRFDPLPAKNEHSPTAVNTVVFTI